MKQCFLCGFDVDLPSIENYIPACVLCSDKILKLTEEIHGEKIILGRGRAYNFPNPGTYADLFFVDAINRLLEAQKIELSNQQCRVCNKSLNHMALYADQSICVCRFCKVLNEL